MDALFGTELSTTVRFAIVFALIVDLIDAAPRAADGLVLEHLSSRRQA